MEKLKTLFYFFRILFLLAGKGDYGAGKKSILSSIFSQQFEYLYGFHLYLLFYLENKYHLHSAKICLKTKTTLLKSFWKQLEKNTVFVWHPPTLPPPPLPHLFVRPFKHSRKYWIFCYNLSSAGRTRRQSELQLCSSSKLPLPNDWEYEFTIADRNGNYKVTCTLDQSGDQNCDRDVPDLYCSIICVQPKCPWLLNPQLTK